MRVNVTIDVPTATSAESVVALRGTLSRLFSDIASRPYGNGTIDGPADRVERSCILTTPRRMLESLAARRPVSYVYHGSLRVPKDAERPFEAAVRYLRRDSAMERVVTRVEHSRTQYTLRIVHNGNDRYDPASHTIAWDPTSALRTTEGGEQSPALGLGHECAHAAARPSVLDHGERVRLARYDNAEERRVIRGAEAHAARTLREAQRYDHRGTLYRVASPVVC
ncbi:MAG: hypothetical protein JO043_13580 [Candidatus Eremiobacteraeota bacterium]|nr:hypothetical protein [Candidatus Eremiobacteraeota bacterium]